MFLRGRSVCSNKLPPLSCPVRPLRPFSSSSSAYNLLPSSPSPLSGTPSPFYITTPIFYVNAAPHIGHLHSMLLADVLARYARLVQPNRRVIFSTGTDEHGLKIQNAAKDNKISPQQMCDANSARFKALASAANISYTTFIRTTEDRHKIAVQHMWKELLARGHIYKGSHSGWYAVSDECFYTESQIQEGPDGNKVAIESGSKVEWSEEENYKFRLSAFKEPLLKWLSENPEAMPLNEYRSNTMTYFEDLKDLSISRPSSRLTWGVPVPDDENHTIYVWMDALVNYLTVLGWPWKEGVNAEQMGWPADYQVVGKDIVRFHAVFWPAFLMALSLPPPKSILVHAHWTQDQFKMSKSRGNVADPFKAIESAGVDSVRAYLMGIGGSLADDSDYSYSALLMFHKLLSDQIGNLLNRFSGPKITNRLLDPSIPESQLTTSSSSNQIQLEVLEGEETIDKSLREIREIVEKKLEKNEISSAIMEILRVVAEANAFYSSHSPWASTTATSSVERAYIYASNTLRITSILLLPILPTKMETLLDKMGVPKEERTWEAAAWTGKTEPGSVLAGRVDRATKLMGKKVLFERIVEV
ncbi:methionine-trna ligase [Phaffia rhodozyma]|uniref:Probable methionine--tRNA ligase, mitochondrial n=1 Tax=Phaffia rhodozyma TaxID=264483 RepID=A0A0F7SLD5_PHARH|nr:methionine-trna ligase [Phaffia rhodozyma]